MRISTQGAGPADSRETAAETADPAGCLVPGDGRARSIWVQGQLRLHASSFAAVARSLGVSGRAVGQALFMPNHRIECELARILGLPVQRLFPERHDADGRRLHAVRRPRAGGAA